MTPHPVHPHPQFGRQVGWIAIRPPQNKNPAQTHFKKQMKNRGNIGGGIPAQWCRHSGEGAAGSKMDPRVRKGERRVKGGVGQSAGRNRGQHFGSLRCPIRMWLDAPPCETGCSAGKACSRFPQFNFRRRPGFFLPTPGGGSQGCTSPLGQD